MAIIVAYRPDEQVLRAILDGLARQCFVVLADNSPGQDVERMVAAWLPAENGICIAMHGNRGIGAAQNRAIAWAWQKGANAVLLLDDDSIPPDHLVDRLVACAIAAGGAAVVGANAVDDRGREISNARYRAGDMPRCRDMMSSGALISRSIFARVGPFDESLFIDGVDFDWGWRAQRMGVTLHLCRATEIRHRLGEGSVVGIRYPSPIRHYFQYRNNLRLMTRSYVPWGWRIPQFFKLTAKLGVIAVLMPQKSRRLRYALAGVRDAMRGRGGPWPEPRRVERSR